MTTRATSPSASGPTPTIDASMLTMQNILQLCHLVRYFAIKAVKTVRLLSPVGLGPPSAVRKTREGARCANDRSGGAESAADGSEREEPHKAGGDE
mmetsp:Transcript_34081/g.84307  ORF Transcript_34081/g.84307 Transcript_34081/m.84307 type:complete len:96 (-) Transcript_34081:603-890(-)